MLMRPGYSVIELLVAVVLSALVLGLLGVVSARQQRFSREVVVSVERNIESGQAAELLPIALRSVSPQFGDIPAGGARDTSLEFRATIATSVVCDTAPNTIALAPSHPTPPAFTSVLSRPETGDTAWTLALAGSDTWTAHAITGVVDSTYRCRVGSVMQWPGDPPAGGLVLRVAGGTSVASGSPVRITRPWRYSLYRSSDGQWYLGAKDWNPASAKFNTIQPVSGPFLSAAAHGLAFRYYDSTHTEIVPASPDTRSIALVEITIRSDTTLPGRFSHLVSAGGVVAASVALRNR
jgi:hypothetical protein